MPRRMTYTAEGTHQTLKNTAYESMVISWLMQDGWQVFIPILDNGHQTDILISDGPNFHRIQVKTLEPGSEEHPITNRWQDSHVNVVVAFARNSNWGYVMPAFSEPKRALNSPGHIKFDQTKNDFLRAFHLLD
ncbi:group I intron-associated PD-(D/E)XK endonuclease [Ferrimonas balearica]|uniref:group I intron-associated PD-(D/E)XK endonuclease n=1 Tax=Ferrimonas balearica TaxID=44012 RepID=UPI001C570C2C|nr:group I intron-associated PD-(D/E)XK endonuclease [Ferrimonas balearica]MBW3139201.1 hypothetical protein [Ferrimonas balearica]MBW3163210.1 hypothetical protein [Ferrimonas balearica]